MKIIILFLLFLIFEWNQLARESRLFFFSDIYKKIGNFMKTIIITESQYNLMRDLTGHVRKGDVRLKEDVDANLGSAPGIQQAIQKAKQTMTRNANVDTVSADAGKLDGSSDMSSGEGMKLQIPVNASGQEISTAQNLVKNQANDDMQIQFTKPMTNGQPADENPIGESVMNLRRTMPEFSKKDFDRLLKSL